MAKPITARYEDFVIEVNKGTAGAPQWQKICGMRGYTMNRTANVQQTEVPADCDDESLPLAIEKEIQSLNFTLSGQGAWALREHGFMQDWFYGSERREIRVTNVVAQSQGDLGTPFRETGFAFMTQLNNDRQKGQKVSADIAFEFDGTPTREAVDQAMIDARTPV